MNRSKLKGAAVRAAGLAAGLAVSGWAQAQAFQNGGFEDPFQPEPGLGISAYNVVVPNDLSLTGWTVVGHAGLDPIDQNVNLVRSLGSYKQGAVTTTQWIDLTGGRETNPNPTGGYFGNGVTQTFSLLAGQPYRLTYWVGSLLDGPYTHAARVQMNLNGATQVVETPAAGSGTNFVTQWQPYSFDFVAQATNTLTFTALRPDLFLAGATYTGLDDVVITAIPEPMSYLLALSGLGLIAGVVRRRRSRQA